MKKNLAVFFSLIIFLISCNEESKKIIPKKGQLKIDEGVSLVILGTVQDAGSPHIACKKDCCKGLIDNPDINRKVVSIGLIDAESQKTFLLEATPDITSQLRDLQLKVNFKTTGIPDGIFLTHAHIGHYTGLMYLGKEATNAKKVPVYSMPKMKAFLEENGPWSQLAKDENITLIDLENRREIMLTPNLKVIPFKVPHRDEYSETVGYKIAGPNKSILFIPDIDKWRKWEASIVSEIEKVDYAFLDASFYNAAEINNRDIAEIPHPFVIESMEIFKNLSASEKGKIHFIHFNHTNPLLNPESEQSKKVLKKGYQIARLHQQFNL